MTGSDELLITAKQVIDALPESIRGDFACHHIGHMVPLQISQGVITVFRCLACGERVRATTTVLAVEFEWETGLRMAQ